MAVQRVTINDPISNCGILFGSNSLLVSEIFVILTGKSTYAIIQNCLLQHWKK